MLRTIFALLICLTVHADKYVRDGGGSSACTTWTDACDQLTTALGVVSRGETIWVADGAYTGVTLDVANSGTSIVTIKKATTSAHGTETGWSAGYGDGQATFGDFIVATNYWVVDGATRNESDWGDGAAYGFRISTTLEANSSQTNTCADNITVQYTNLGGAEGTTYTGSEPDEATQVSCFIGGQVNNSWIYRRNYFHNIAHSALMLLSSMDGATIEYNLFKNAFGKEAIRGQFVSKNIIIRYNQFFNSCGTAPPDACTADIAMWSGDTEGSHDNNEVYGNWFVMTRDGNTGGKIVIGGDGTSWVGVVANNTKIYNNTIIDTTGGVSCNILVNGGTGNEVRNTLWYGCVGTPGSSPNTSNNGEEQSDPFINYAAWNLHLSAGLSGYALGSPYNADMDGIIRGADGTFDRGAFEYQVGGGGADFTQFKRRGVGRVRISGTAK